MRADHADLLAASREKILARLAAIDERLAQIRDARSGATDDDEHDPEGGTLSAEWSRAEGQREDALRDLSELDAALARLAAGQCGVCAACGRGIPLERLRLRPAATLCVPCATAVGH